MKNKRYALILLFLISDLSISGCGKKQDDSKATSSSTEKSSLEQEKLVIDPKNVSIIKGKVLFKGETPKLKELPISGNPECKVFHPSKVLSEEVMVKDGALQNVFIYVKDGLENYEFEAPKEAVKVDQVKCIYVPHVTGAQVDQPIVLVNSDPTLHNVHSYSQGNPTWNLGMPFEGMEITKTFSKPEIMVTMKCDIHPWMTGYIGVLPHPYFAITGPDGNFEIKNLPLGTYTVEAWHEKLGTQTQEIQFTSQETKELEFSFEPSN